MALRMGIAVQCGCTLGGQSSGDLDVCVTQILERLDTDEERSGVLGFGVAELHWIFEREQAVNVNWLVVTALEVNAMPGPTTLRYSVERGEGAAVVQGDCETRAMTLPVLLHVKTDDGLLDESLQGTMTASRVGFVKISSPLDLGAIAGSLRIAPGSAQRLQVALDVFMTPTASSGSFAGLLEQHYDEETSGSGVVLMNWPQGSQCSIGEVADPLDENESDSAWSLLTGLHTTWLNSEETYSLDVSEEVQLCTSARGPANSPATIFLSGPQPGPVALQGRIEEELIAGATRRSLRFTAVSAEEKPEEFIRRFGDFGLPLLDYQLIRLGVTMTVTQSNRSGLLRIGGYTYSCPEGATCSSPGERILYELPLFPRTP
ncbi:MAG: hypothetical protein ABI895_34395 [Deltaproteobacteria bacterium]